jgi:hypothetical protein
MALTLGSSPEPARETTMSTASSTEESSEEESRANGSRGAVRSWSVSTAHPTPSGPSALAAHLARSVDVDLVVLHALGLMTVIEGRHVPSEGHRDDIERLLRTEWCRCCRATRS